ncbi:MAG TPA: tetratricopeptide repeat protein, partial [Burkholderiales bacterium]|nr:tetratricopeptide repeat protein [Burkholderiales bacterium]
MPSLNDQLQKAWEQLQSGNTQSAIGVIESILRRAPAHPRALSMLGMAHVATGDASKAVNPLERALQSDPQNGMALDSLGLAYLSLGRFSDAAQVLQRAAAIPHAPAIVFMRLG